VYEYLLLEILVYNVETQAKHKDDSWFFRWMFAANYWCHQKDHT